MFNPAMMDPELMRIAQEQMSRIPPQELAKMQQKMMSNPELMKLATESMKNMRPEDMRIAAEQLKHTRFEDMADIGEKMAKATPEELASMHAQAESQISYRLSAAEMLKKQGNMLHNSGNYHDAAQKYNLAKNSLKDVPPFKCRTLLTQCSVNLMSCYLKTGQFSECIKEGSDVLLYDSKNVKALYRRGQAYKELGKFEAAVSDLSKAHEVSPDDDIILDVLQAAKEQVRGKAANSTVSGGVVIEELVEVESEISEGSSSSSSCNVVREEVTNDIISSPDFESLRNLQENPETLKLFQNFVSTTDPASLASMGGMQMSPEMIKSATEMISKMKSEELQTMLQTASSMKGHIPEMTPEMVQIASEKIRNMSPDELEKVVEFASSMDPNLVNSDSGNQRTEASSNASGSSSSSVPSLSSAKVPPNAMSDMGENFKSMTKDPAMRQMFTSMMKNMSPEMMSSMSKQFGVKLSTEDVAKAQQAMSSLSPEDLEKMMKWAERVQTGIEKAKKTKNWLMGRKGLIMAICMLILAFIFHQLGFIGS